MNEKRIFLVTLLAGVAWASLTAATVADSAADPTGLATLTLAQNLFGETREASRRDDFPPLSGATTWLNSPPLTPAQLRGKVVLIDFWTYSCINWRREFPYVKAWAKKYRDHGLVVIGIHSPEFNFEKDLDNVKRAVRDIRVDYPVAVDNDHAIWHAFANAYWPALYFIDARGRVRHHHFGEGDYEPSERTIQQLLSEAGAADVPTDLVGPTGSGAEAAPDWQNLRSPETYVGFGRATHLASTGVVRGSPRTYEGPLTLKLNHWALVGSWTLNDEAARLNKANGRIAHRFHARDLHLVMGSASRDRPVQFRVTIDGKPPGAARGDDIDELGRGTLSEHRMYHLIRQREPITDRRFEIEFLDPDVEVFSFTFG